MRFLWKEQEEEEEENMYNGRIMCGSGVKLKSNPVDICIETD